MLIWQSRSVTSTLAFVIIMAGMTVFLRGWLPHRGEAQMACNYCFPTRTIFWINSAFWRKGMFRWENLTSHLVRMKNSSYYIAPVGDWTHDLPHTVASNMVKVSHTLNHLATEAIFNSQWAQQSVNDASEVVSKQAASLFDCLLLICPSYCASFIIIMIIHAISPMSK